MTGALCLYPRYAAVAVCFLGCLLIPEAGQTEPHKDLTEALNAPFPVSRIVDQAIGGAQQPEIVASTFVAAIKRFKNSDKTKFSRRYRELAQGLNSALSGGKSKPTNLARGFQSHRSLMGRLDGATTRLRQPGAFQEPLEGGEDLSLPLDGLGTLLAISAVDDLSRKRLKSAENYGRHLLQLGRLVAGAARTLKELEASVSMVKRGLSLLSASYVRRKKPALEESEQLRALGVDIATFARRLRSLREAMRKPSNVSTWVDVARKNAKLLWQHVALDALALIARKHPESTDAKEALRVLSRRNDRIGIAAGVRLSRLK